MSGLPQGWATAVLADLIASDGVFSDGDWVESKDQDPHGSIRLLQLADIGDGVFLDKSSRFINELKFDQLRCTEVLEGDVLVARMPDPLGRACLAPRLQQRCITVVDVAIVRPGHSSVQSAWLMHFLNAPEVRQEIEVQSSGTTRRRISRSNLAQLQLPVAPLNEQKRIADKLDAVLARVDACRERLDCVPVILKRFRQAVLAAATSGKLTEEWRAASQGRTPWTSVRLRELTQLITKGASPKWQGFSYVDSDAMGTLFITSENVREMQLDVTEPKYVESAFNDAQRRSILQQGDLLTNIVGASIGRTAIYDLAIPANINQAVCLVRLKEGISGRFILYSLSSPSVIAHIHSEKVDVARANLSLEDVGNIPLAIPRRDEQDEIVRRVEALFVYADRLEARYTAARAQVDRLTPALLAKAFRGELVPQDPKDEPAVVLLERIRAARAEQPTAKRGRKPTAARVPRAPREKAAMTKSRQDDDVLHKPYLAGLLREAGGNASVEDLFRRAELPVTDFYKQLAWEVENGHIRDDETRLEAA